MPEQYLAIKRAMKKKGKSDKTAKRIAAAKFNKDRKPGQKPVTGSPRGR